MHNFAVLGKIKKSNNLLYYISTQICQYFTNDLHQFIWIQLYFSRYYSTAKLFQVEKSVFQGEKSLLTSPLRFITCVVYIDPFFWLIWCIEINACIFYNRLLLIFLILATDGIICGLFCLCFRDAFFFESVLHYLS